MNQLSVDSASATDQVNPTVKKWIAILGSLAAVLALALLLILAKTIARLAGRQTASNEVASEAKDLGMPGGAFEAKWLMSMSAVQRAVPNAVPDGQGSLILYKAVYGRPAKISFGFQNDYLVVVVVTMLPEANEVDFASVQAQLVKEYGPMPDAVPAEGFKLLSKRKVGRFLIEHYLGDIGKRSLEQIIFCRTD